MAVTTKRRVGGEVLSLALSPDARSIAAGDAGGMLRLFGVTHHGLVVGQDGVSVAVSPEEPPGFPKQLREAALSSVAAGALPRHGTVIAAGAADGSVTVVAAGDGAVIAELPAAHGRDVPVTGVALAGTQLLTAGEGEVRVWRLPTMQPTHTVAHEGRVTALAVAQVPDADAWLVVSGDDTGRVRFWQLRGQAAPRPQQRAAHGRAVTAAAAAASARGLLVVTGCDDGSVVRWAVTASPDGLTLDAGRDLGPLRGPVRGVGVIDDRGGRLVVAGGEDDDVRFWRVDEGAPSRLPHPGGVRALAVGRIEPSTGRPEPLGVIALAGTDGEVELITTREIPRSAGRPDAWGISDAPIDDDAEDRLGFDHYADALAYMIDHPRTSTPLTMAIDAPWGAGKTSLGGLIMRRLTPPGDHPARTTRGLVTHISCWFDAWMHDDAESLASALAATVVRAVDRERPRWRRVLRPVPGRLLARQDRIVRSLLVVFAALVLGVVTMLLAPQLPREVAGELAAALELIDEPGDIAGPAPLFGFSLVFLVAVGTKAFGWLSKLGVAVATYVNDPARSARTGSIAEVRAQLGQLIHEATRRRGLARPRRLVLFIDNLERCQPPRALEICEVVSQLLSHEDVVTVLMVDMRSIAASAEVRYEPLARRLYPATEGAGYGRDFLDKIVQFQFTVPAHTTPQLEELFQHSLTAAQERRQDAQPPLGARLGRALRRPLAALGRPLQTLSPRRAYRAVADAVRRRRDRGAARRRVRAASTMTGWTDTSKDAFDFLRHAWLPVSAVAIVAVSATGEDERGWSAGWALGLSVLVLLVVVALESRRVARQIEEKRLERQDRVLTKYLGEHPATTPSVSGAAQQLQSQLQGLGLSIDPVLLNWRVRQALIDDSATRGEAEAEALCWLPPVPRQAKRLANRLLVSLAIAFERGLLGGDSPVTPRHLGKWVAFAERWPRIARLVAEEPTFLRELERALEEPAQVTGVPVLERRPDGVETADRFRDLLAARGVLPLDVHDLRVMLGERPRLSQVAVVLTQYTLQPASPAPAPTA